MLSPRELQLIDMALCSLAAGLGEWELEELGNLPSGVVHHDDDVDTATDLVSEEIHALVRKCYQHFNVNVARKGVKGVT
jgi:hypothetical protein